jgi:hypothetical protein
MAQFLEYELRFRMNVSWQRTFPVTSVMIFLSRMLNALPLQTTTATPF